MRTLITQDYVRAFERVDCILAPVAPRTAFRFGEVSDPTEMYLSDMFTISINIAGNGGMSMPVGLGADTNLPVGVQLISPQFKDENMLRVAAALEAVYGPAPIAPPLLRRQNPEAPAAIPDAADAVPGVDLPGLATAGRPRRRPPSEFRTSRTARWAVRASQDCPSDRAPPRAPRLRWKRRVSNRAQAGRGP